MKKYVCTVCGWVYDPAEGDPEGGIAPGTAFEEMIGFALFAEQVKMISKFKKIDPTL